MPAEDTQVLQPTSAQEWGAKKQGFLAELPSGQVARIRRTLDLTVMLKQGRIPNPLNGIIMEMIQKQKTEFDMSKLNEDTLRQFLSLVDDTVCQCFVEPVCEQPQKKSVGQEEEDYQKYLSEWKPTPGAISIEWVDSNDKMFVFAVAQGAATDLASFRAEQSPDVALVGAGEAVEAAT